MTCVLLAAILSGFVMHNLKRQTLITMQWRQVEPQSSGLFPVRVVWMGTIIHDVPYRVRP